MRSFAWIIMAGFALLGVLSPTAFGDVIVDRFSNHALWATTGPQHVVAHGLNFSTVGNAPAAFRGNGQRLETIGYGFSHSLNGEINQGDPGLIRWRFALYTGTDDFIADPYALNRPAGMFMDFLQPSNPDWRTVVGNQGFREIRFVNFNVSALNLTLTPDHLYLATVMPHAYDYPGGNNFNATLALSNPGGIGTELDWYQSDLAGPGTLQALGASRPYGSWLITTSVVPSPASSVVLLFGVATLRRRTR